MLKSAVRALLCITLNTLATPAQVHSKTKTTPTHTKAAASGTARPDSFSAKGLNYEHEFTALYLGDFAQSRLRNDNYEFNLLLATYIYAFSTRCADALPADKVEITEHYCKVKQQQVNRYGVPVYTQSTCVEWADARTGRYGDPKVVAAEASHDAKKGTYLLGAALDALREREAHPLAASTNMSSTEAGVNKEMDGLLRINGCASQATKRFQDNLVRFATDQPPVVMGWVTPLPVQASRHPSAASGREADYPRLMEDLVEEQSRSWMMNRYQQGSITDVQIVEKSNDGGASVIQADYGYLSSDNRLRGSVKLVFDDGVPKCLYFSDFPNACRGVSKRISTAYENGEYQK